MCFQSQYFLSFENLAEFLEDGVKAFDMSDLEDTLRFSRSIDESFSFSNSSGDRLLDQDMNTRLETSNPDFVVQPSGYSNTDSIDLGN